MKRVKQLASVVLAAVLLVSGVPFSVSAATTGFHKGDVVYERWGNGGNNSDEENCFLALPDALPFLPASLRRPR